MVAELEQLGVKLMVSIWPTVSPASENYTEMAEGGLLVGNERGLSVQLAIWDRGSPGRVPMTFYDATNPEARAYIWAKVKEGYYQHGIRTWWLDACEPELVPEQPENLRYHLGPGAEVTNIYPMLHAKGFYDGMRAEGRDRDPQPVPVGVGGQPALRGPGLVRRHRFDLRRPPPPDPGRAEHRAVRHPVVDHGHRRLQERRHRRRPRSAS